MSETITRVDYLEGIRVNVVTRRDKIDLTVTIKPGADLRKEQESSDCRIRFKTHGTKRIADEPMIFRAINQKYDKRNPLNNFRKNFSMEEGGECTISLFPTFFLPEDLATAYKPY